MGREKAADIVDLRGEIFHGTRTGVASEGRSGNVKAAPSGARSRRKMPEAHAWNEKLDLGHEALDHEHHLQIALVSALIEAVEGRRPVLARRFAGQVTSYSQAHFGSEEVLMESSAYGGLADHAEEHRTLLEAMREIESALEREETELALAFAVELRAGLAGHMAGSDQRLVTHLQPPEPERRVVVPFR